MRNILINILIRYKQNISPIIRPKCRFIPTCSEYAILALKKYNILKALSLILWRLLRCTPLTKIDTVDLP
jgi:hypothetical protein